MKITLVFLFSFHFSAFAQCDSTNIVDFPEVEAHFPGGPAEMVTFIRENVDYSVVESSNIGLEESRIYLEFVVCEDGSLTNIAFRREVNENLKKMSIDLISKMPNWIPAEHGGKIVASKCHIPITICFN